MRRERLAPFGLVAGAETVLKTVDTFRVSVGLNPTPSACQKPTETETRRLKPSVSMVSDSPVNDGGHQRQPHYTLNPNVSGTSPSPSRCRTTAARPTAASTPARADLHADGQLRQRPAQLHRQQPARGQRGHRRAHRHRLGHQLQPAATGANEAGQTVLAYTVSNVSNPGLFAVARRRGHQRQPHLHPDAERRGHAHLRRAGAGQRRHGQRRHRHQRRPDLHAHRQLRQRPAHLHRQQSAGGQRGQRRTDRSPAG